MTITNVIFSETNEPVTENTIYGLASVSKHFTTTLLGQALSYSGKGIIHFTIVCMRCLTEHGIGNILLTFLLFYSLGRSWDAKVHDTLADLGTDFYFYDPLRSNLTSLRDLGSHSTGIAANDYLMIFQNMSRSEQADRLR